MDSTETTGHFVKITVMGARTPTSISLGNSGLMKQTWDSRDVTLKQQVMRSVSLLLHSIILYASRGENEADT